VRRERILQAEEHLTNPPVTLHEHPHFRGP
jgi:hypothetical protein